MYIIIFKIQTNIMKKNIVFLMIFCSFLNVFCYVFNSFEFNCNRFKTQVFATETAELVKYKGDIPHFFVHEIVRDEDLAFSYSNSLSNHFDRDCITHVEFKRFLEEMHKSGYALIDIYDVIGFDENQIPYQKEICFPADKKPMLLSFDDMTYDSRGRGMCDKLIVDKNGKMASFTRSALPQIEHGKDNISILEEFIENNQDFSFNNARAIICPTGYNGVLGYRINKDNPNHKEEIKKVQPVIAKLKELGYHFGSHTFDHIQVGYASPETLKNDLKKYNEQIIPVIGKTDILCFPCGSRTVNEQKIEILKSFGYKIMLCIGIHPSFQEKYGTAYLDRKVVDGNALRTFHKYYSQYFDTYVVYDNQKRKIKI